VIGLRDSDSIMNMQGEVAIHEHPVDFIEPVIPASDQIRDARMMCVHLLNDFAVEMLAALSECRDPVLSAKIRLHGISYAMGLSICDTSMSDCADRLGVSRATISKVAVNWNAAHDLPPSFHQKSDEAIHSYAATRREVVASINGSNGNGEVPHAAQ
jgi:hypothetical protein